MKISTLLHLRIPFSFFLLPVFMLACAISPEIDFNNLFLCFFILHVLIYPASNGYNSYFDKDEQSIGGLKNPPKVSKELYWVALFMDLAGLCLGLLISLDFVIMIFIYGMISKAYSHPTIRLKKYPVTGWLAAGIFQGYFTYLLSVMAIAPMSFGDTLTLKIQLPGILSSLLLLGSYPMTQVYQHDEDRKRGDETISRRLGILGTFHFTAIAFSVATFGFTYYFLSYASPLDAYLFLVFLFPVLVYFGRWYLRVRGDHTEANFTSTMRLNLISSLMLNAFFIYLWVN